jgi:hypothetical protein
MADAAHGESLDHEVYRTPYVVEPEFEQWDTPPNYHDRHLGLDKLPKKMKVWLVQDGRKVGGKIPGSVVARAYGFTDSPDAEALALGFNTGKEYGAVGVGRHGNFLQWGYSLPPSQMTEAGRKFFLNCICYIHRFDGKAPLIHEESSHRLNAMRLARLINQIEDKKFFSHSFSDELMAKYEGDPEGLTEYYRDNLELVYRDRVYTIDAELKSLGFDSNRKLSTLDRLIDLLDDRSHAKTAHLLLVRYTDFRDTQFGSADTWRSWFEKNKDRTFFSDVGGYKFFVVPEGYLDSGGG